MYNFTRSATIQLGAVLHYTRICAYILYLIYIIYFYFDSSYIHIYIYIHKTLKLTLFYCYGFMCNNSLIFPDIYLQLYHYTVKV